MSTVTQEGPKGSTSPGGQERTHLDQIEDEPGGHSLPHHIDEEVREGHSPDEGVFQHVVDEQAQQALLGFSWSRLRTTCYVRNCERTARRKMRGPVCSLQLFVAL